MIINPADIPHQDRYKLIIGAVLPRPIAWVSSMDSKGNLNVAPFSFFTAVCSNPMTVIFCASYSPEPDKNGKKDTLHNIEETREFVVNFTNEATAAAMNLTSAILPRGQSEFEFAGITPIASEVVKTPRIAEAPIAYECKLQQIVTVSDQPGGGSAIFGEVQRIHIRDDIYNTDKGYIILDKYKPIGRLGGMAYTRVTDIFEMRRP
jgi:flavin reductase (DIM6/NTAB) family NADH-FMN oxidoreductase RutF